MNIVIGSNSVTVPSNVIADISDATGIVEAHGDTATFDILQVDHQTIDTPGPYVFWGLDHGIPYYFKFAAKDQFFDSYEKGDIQKLRFTAPILITMQVDAPWNDSPIIKIPSGVDPAGVDMKIKPRVSPDNTALKMQIQLSLIRDFSVISFDSDMVTYAEDFKTPPINKQLFYYFRARILDIYGVISGWSKIVTSPEGDDDDGSGGKIQFPIYESPFFEGDLEGGEKKTLPWTAPQNCWFTVMLIEAVAMRINGQSVALGLYIITYDQAAGDNDSGLGPPGIYNYISSYQCFLKKGDVVSVEAYPETLRGVKAYPLGKANNEETVIGDDLGL